MVFVALNWGLRPTAHAQNSVSSTPNAAPSKKAAKSGKVKTPIITACPEGWLRVDAGQPKSVTVCEAPSGRKIPLQPWPLPQIVVSELEEVEPSRDMSAADWKSPYCRTWEDGCDACQRGGNGDQPTDELKCVSLALYPKFNSGHPQCKPRLIACHDVFDSRLQERCQHFIGPVNVKWKSEEAREATNIQATWPGNRPFYALSYPDEDLRSWRDRSTWTLYSPEPLSWHNNKQVIFADERPWPIELFLQIQPGDRNSWKRAHQQFGAPAIDRATYYCLQPFTQHYLENMYEFGHELISISIFSIVKSLNNYRAKAGFPNPKIRQYGRSN
jgi:hypothetical protein